MNYPPHTENGIRHYTSTVRAQRCRASGRVEVSHRRVDGKPRSSPLSIAVADTERRALELFLRQYGAVLQRKEPVAVPILQSAVEWFAALEDGTTPLPESKDKLRDWWWYLDIGTRGRRPRANRRGYWDPVEERYVKLYADTMKAHRDPDCRCRWCAGNSARDLGMITGETKGHIGNHKLRRERLRQAQIERVLQEEVDARGKPGQAG